MAADLQEVVFDMARGRMLRFADALQHQVFCLGGSLGLTRNDDAHATVLTAGEDYVCDGTGVVMVTALTDARVRLLTPMVVVRPPTAARRTSVLGALLARLRH